MMRKHQFSTLNVFDLTAPISYGYFPRGPIPCRKMLEYIQSRVLNIVLLQRHFAAFMNSAHGKALGVLDSHLTM